MSMKLETRTADHVIVFWNKTQDEEIRRQIPIGNGSLEEALRQYEESQKENATSYGRVICYEEHYIGDVWCYSIDEKSEKMAMLSILLFEKELWGKGIAKEAIKAFVEEVFHKYKLEKIGAFTYSTNYASIALLLKTGFVEVEAFVEEGVESKYFELKADRCINTARI